VLPGATNSQLNHCPSILASTTDHRTQQQYLLLKYITYTNHLAKMADKIALKYGKKYLNKKLGKSSAVENGGGVSFRQQLVVQQPKSNVGIGSIQVHIKDGKEEQKRSKVFRS